MVGGNNVANSHGAYILNSGTLRSPFGSGGTPYSGSFTFGGGTFQANATFNTSNQPTVTTSIASEATAFIDTNGNTVTWSTPLTGASAAGLVKSGAGTLTLSGSNTYTGTTTISQGGITINAVSALPGYATAGGPATISGLHTPGNSPGIETFSFGLTYASGTAGAPSVIWELWGNSSTNSPVVYDQFVVTGTLDFQAATPLSLAFSGGSNVVDWDDSFWGANQSWTIYSVTGTTQNFGNLGLVQDAANWFDSQNVAFAASIRSQGSFAVAQQGSDVVLVYIVPEPGMLACAGIGVCGGGWLIRRRRRETRAR